MYTTQYIDPGKLTTPELCDFLEKAFYVEIRQLVESIQHYIHQSVSEDDGSGPMELFILLFLKLKDELMQMIRNDEIIIFPLIRNDKKVKACPARKLPVVMIQQMHQKIMQLLEKIRQQANNYLPKQNWPTEFKHCCIEMFKLEQEIHKAIFTKENVLLQKVNNEFNQPCSGNCNHQDASSTTPIL